MNAPSHYMETARRVVASQYLRKEHWNDRESLQHIVSGLRGQMGATGLSISIIKDWVYVKYNRRFDFRELSRLISLDSHALLSLKYFVLRDAQKDWRTRFNPFVHGSPFIRFYCGVRLVANGFPIGVLAVFDNVEKKYFDVDRATHLMKRARDLMEWLDAPYESKVKRDSKLDTSNTVTHLETFAPNDIVRALSHGGYPGMYSEGSGSPYSQSRKVRLTKMSNDNKCIKENCLDEAKRLEVNLLMMRAKQNDCAGLICRSIAETHNADFVFIARVRHRATYAISSNDFPNVPRVRTDHFRHTSKLVELGKPEDLESVIQGTFGLSNEIVNFDKGFLKRALKSRFGFKYCCRSGHAKLNSGILVPVLRFPSELVRNSAFSKPGTTLVDLETEGFLVGVFDRTEKSRFDQALISKIFDHASIFRKAYLSRAARAARRPN